MTTNASFPLCEANLERLPSDVARPTYDRRKVRPAIVHFGIGAFHRAHQELYTDAVLASGDLGWGIRGAGITPADESMRDDLAAQDFLYTLTARDTTGEEARVVGSLLDLVVPKGGPEALVRALADPSTRIISMTITENGYAYRADTGNLDLDHPGVRNDLAPAGEPRTIYGYLRAALELVRRERRPAPTVLSCDNLPQNGDRLRRLVLQFLDAADRPLRGWVEQEVSFPNCMVDRITPATTDEQKASIAARRGYSDRRPVFCERFRQWVIEDRFPNGRPDWSIGGATFVTDVVPFERMKIRLLNGSHSTIGYIGYLLGFRKVDEAMGDPMLRAYVRRYMDEVTPTVGVVPGTDLEAYKRSLVERFSNPAIADQVLRLAQDGSKKIPNMILEPVEELLTSGGSIRHAAFAIAAWIRFLEGVDEAGEPITIDDPLGALLHAAALETRSAGVERFLAVGAIFSERLARERPLREAVGGALERIRSRGIRSALEELLRG